MAAECVYPVLMAGAFGTQLLQNSKDNDNIPWWDYIREYYMFPSDYTHIIDDLLSSPFGEMGQKEIVSKHQKKPAVGYHYFYYNKPEDRYIFEKYFRYVKLQKKTKTINNELVTYYRCFVLPGQDHVLDKMVHLIFVADQNSIRIISIDTSSPEPKTFYTTEKYFQSRPYQSKAVNYIIDGYEKDPHYNYKVILSGQRGTGKTLTARMLKKELEIRYPKTMVKLFADFDPSTTAVNVKKLILTEASPTSPIIIVIDEIDEMFNEVHKEKQIFDPRILHTKNRLTFNAMMDAIANTPYTILIGTTEKSIDQLYASEQNHSFMRQGRIDGFINIDYDINNVKLLTHANIDKCTDKLYSEPTSYVNNTVNDIENDINDIIIDNDNYGFEILSENKKTK
jgi:hypothetical protein